LDVGGFGTYSLYGFLIPLGLTLIDLGLTSTVTWEATSGRAADHARLVRALRFMVTWSVLKVPLVFAGSFLLLEGPPAAAILLAAAVSIHVLSQSLFIGLTADRQFKTLAQASFVNALFSTAGVAVAAITTGSAAWTIAAFWTGRIAAAAFGAARISPSLRAHAIRPGALRIDRRAWSFGLTSFGTELVTSWTFGRSELVFLERLGTPFAQGQYALVSTVAQRATLLADALYGALGIALLAIRGGRRDKFLPAFARALRVTALLVIAAGVCLTSLVSELAPPLFGPNFGDVAIPCAVMLAIALLRTALQPLFGWIYAERLQSAMLLPGVIATPLDVALCLLLVPHDPLLGAVVANCAASVVYFAFSIGLARLPREARGALWTCGWRTILVLAICVGVVIVPLPGPVVIEAIGGALVSAALVVALLRRLPPLLDAADAVSLAKAIPGILRPLFLMSLRVFDHKSVAQLRSDLDEGSAL
jgi:O-antigen/teichoic acid export membrane protein